MDLVSVIIPYYQKRKFISKTINSALKQSYKNLEIIIVYDDENCVDLNFIEEIKERDSRISIIKNNKNMGAGISRNIGISKSTGKYIAFLDADDLWMKDKIKYQIRFMKLREIIFSHTSYSIVDSQNMIISKRNAKNFFRLKDLIKSCDIGLSTVMIKRCYLNNNKFPNLKFSSLYIS